MEGNQQKMREALQKIRKIADINICECVGDYSDKAIIEIADAALSAPPRNCDVGTADEQSDRFANLCNSHSGCSQCPVKSLWNFANGREPSCGVLWAQMPYEEKEGAGK